MANRLIHEKSPYLLQHAENPVDWHPWGEEAFEKAQRENKPIFLSIGYATCHWCHVMERESFEDEEVAKLLNEHVVSIKVDREERPDVDQIYMTVCQVLTGSGGWPLSIFMTPERKPFFAGSYFPKHGRMGMQGFMDIIMQVSRLWKQDPARLIAAGEEVTGAIQPRKSAAKGEIPDLTILEKGYQQLRTSFDPTWGGFGRAPKFPTPHHLTFLLRWHKRNPQSEALAMVEKTLDAMRKGGIFDQVGFGFHRYSVDERWFAPHFEKMLYDQAMLAMAYTEAFQATGKEEYGWVSREILSYALRDMTDPEGGFYSGEDADSEGKEGLFYLWTPTEVKEILGEEAGQAFCRFYDISSLGNFEDHRSIAHIAKTPEVVARQLGMDVKELENIIEEGAKKLFLAREARVHPFKDDKILTSWNGLMIAAFAKGYQVLHDPDYIQAASGAAELILNVMRDDSGRLYRRRRQGETAVKGHADDYSFFIWGLIELYEAAFDVRWLEEAVRLQERMLDLFWDEEQGGFHFTGADAESLIVRDKEIYDAAVPSSNSVAALNLMRLSRMTGNTSFEEKASELMKAFSGLVSDFPSAYTQFLNAVDFARGPVREIVVAGDFGDGAVQAMISAVQGVFLPNRVLMLREEDGDARLAGVAPHLAALHPVDGKPTAFICENYACREPITETEELSAALQ